MSLARDRRSDGCPIVELDAYTDAMVRDLVERLVAQGITDPDDVVEFVLADFRYLEDGEDELIAEAAEAYLEVT